MYSSPQMPPVDELPDKDDRSNPGGGWWNPGPGGPTAGLTFGGAGGATTMDQRNPALTMFAPQRKLYGQAYGGMASRAQPSVGGVASTFANSLASARSSTTGASEGSGIQNPRHWRSWAPGDTTNPGTGTTGTGTGTTGTGTNPYQPGTTEYQLWEAFNKNTGMPTNIGGYWGALGTGAMNQMIGSGMLNPNGSQSMIDALRGTAVTDADALRARGNTAASLAGLDPAQAASQSFQQDMGQNGEIQRMLMNAQLQSMTQNRATLSGITGATQDAAWQAWLRQYAQAQP